MRPANIVTSVADVLAGIAIAGFFSGTFTFTEQILPVILLIGSTKCLYGGGVVFNDVFDADLDRIERPERPIPSGIISTKEATILAMSLLFLGILAAFFVNMYSGFIALGIALFAIVYDKWGKHHSLLGPLNMGLCRGLNLLLGISIIAFQLSAHFYLAVVPIIYIAAITMVSRGEVHGGKRSSLYFASFLYLLVITALIIISAWESNLWLSLIFLLAFAWMIFHPLLKAIAAPAGKNIGKAVKAGVIAIIFLNASWAAAFGAPWVALIIVFLLPLSLYLAKKFAVT